MSWSFGAGENPFTISPQKTAAGALSLGEVKKPHSNECSAQPHSAVAHHHDKLGLDSRATCAVPGGGLMTAAQAFLPQSHHVSAAQVLTGTDTSV